MLLPNFNLLTSSWCFYRGSGGGDGYLVSNFCWKIPYYIQSLCVHGQGGRGQPNVERCEVLGSKILKLCEHPLWMAFHFGNCSCARRNKTTMQGCVAFKRFLREFRVAFSDLRSETKGFRFQCGCQLCAEVSSL